MPNTAYIGPSIHITGEVAADEPLTIAGRVSGPITVSGHMLTIEAGAHTEADITADTIVISGDSHGCLTATARIVVGGTATIEGHPLGAGDQRRGRRARSRPRRRRGPAWRRAEARELNGRRPMTGVEAFGPNLRRMRLRRGISLYELSVRTKVSVELWDAMEGNDVSRWPAGLYARAYIREYAEVIGADPDATVDEFCRLFPQGDRRAESLVRDHAELLGHPLTWSDDLPAALAGDDRRVSSKAAGRCHSGMDGGAPLCAARRRRWISRRLCCWAGASRKSRRSTSGPRSR